MEKLLKTREVSEQLGVNPTTVQRWIKSFDISCETNVHGHYLIAPQQLELLKKIKLQLKQGLTMKDIREIDEAGKVNQGVNTNKKEKMVPIHVFEEKLEQLMIHIEQIERKLSCKADEVVGYQVLQQRTEVDNMVSLLSSIEERMNILEQQTPLLEKKAVGGLERVPEQLRKPRQNKLMKMFSL